MQTISRQALIVVRTGSEDRFQSHPVFSKEPIVSFPADVPNPIITTRRFVQFINYFWLGSDLHLVHSHGYSDAKNEVILSTVALPHSALIDTRIVKAVGQQKSKKIK